MGLDLNELQNDWKAAVTMTDRPAKEIKRVADCHLQGVGSGGGSSNMDG